MPMIRECIVTTIDLAGAIHLAPLGIIEDDQRWIIAPFHPSRTLDNLRAVPFATASFTDDVRIFAGCLTGRRDWPLAPCEGWPVPRLADCLAHMALRVAEVAEDAQRPRFACDVLAHVAHRPFAGFNRAQSAVIEAAILASRLHMLPRERIEAEMAIHRSALLKTAGPRELEAWRWLGEKIASHWAADAAKA